MGLQGTFNLLLVPLMHIVKSNYAVFKKICADGRLMVLLREVELTAKFFFVFLRGYFLLLTLSSEYITRIQSAHHSFFFFFFPCVSSTEMVESMKNVAGMDVELTVEERNLLSVAYKNVIGARRASWRIISSIEQREENKGGEEKLKMIREYRQTVKASKNNSRTSTLHIVCRERLRCFVGVTVCHRSVPLFPKRANARSRLILIKHTVSSYWTDCI